MPRGLLLALAALALAAPTRAQAPADTARRTVSIPAPDGPGVIYFRAGERGARPARPGRRPPQRAAPARAAEAPSALARRAAQDPRGVSRLDLLLLEQSLLRAIDERLAALDRSPRTPPPLAPDRQAPVIVLPGTPAAPAAPPPAAAPEPTPGAPAPAPAEPLPSLLTEVERAILDTGLFRTTRVNFEFGEAGILPVSRTTLDAVAEVLRRYPGLRIRVGGHTDSVSSEAFNLALSQRRAEAVRDALIGAGVAADRVEAVGFGEAAPVASNETETGRALNRRVEFEVLNPEAATQERRTVREGPSLGDILREELERLRDGQ